MHYKALIFDMDGTLMDNMSYHKKSWIELFKHHKLDLDYNTFDKKIFFCPDKPIFFIIICFSNLLY